MHKKSKAHRIISFVLNLALIFYSLAPGLSSTIAYAQEITPTPVVEPTVAPTDTPTPTPTETVTPTATPDITLTPTPELSPAPTETITPTPQPENTPTSTPTDNTNQPNAPPTGEQPTQAPEITPAESPTPTITTIPTPEIQGNLHAIILENTNAQTLQLDLATQDVSSASLITDKADYAPTDAAVITGSDFPKETDLKLVITADNYRFEASVKTDSNGSFIYSYQLDGTYRPLYKVEAYDISGALLATVTFTDSPIKITAKEHEGQEKVSGVLNGYTSGNVTEYAEGDTINFRFGLEATHGPTSGQLEIRYTGDDGTCLFFDGSFALGSIEAISGSQPTVTTVGSPTQENFGTSNGEWVQILNINYPGIFGHDDPDSKTRVNYTLKLSNEAGQCNGSSQHSRLNPAGGAVEQSGQQNVPVPANQVIELPDITVTKNIDRNGDGNFESTASFGEYSFTLDGTTTLSTNASGQAIFTDVTPDGAHTITETQVDFSQGTYQFASGSGTNCSFSGSTATATIASGTTATNATCIFNNRISQGTLTVNKVLVPSSDSGRFNLKVDGTTYANDAGDGGSTGAQTVTPGNHIVSETAGTGTDLSDYTTVISGDCDAQGNVNVAAGSSKTCTITNTRKPKLTVTKAVVNDNGGTKQVSDFPLFVDGGSVTSGVQNTFGIGSHVVSETSEPSYGVSISGDCDSQGNVTLSAGDVKSCIITNDDQQGTLIVVKTVINDNGGTLTKEGFSFQVNGGNPIPFEADEQNDVAVNAGTYTVTEPAAAGYATSYNNCSNVNIPNGGTQTCYITNNDIQPKLTVTKIVTNDNGGTKVVSDFPLFVDQTSVASGVQNGFNVGTYTVSETGQAGYTGAISGDCAQNGSIVLAIGDVKSCTITNDDQPGSISGMKFKDKNGNGIKDGVDTGLSEWTINLSGPVNTSIQTDGSGNYTFSNLPVGTYTVTENTKTGWMQTTLNPAPINLTNGQGVTGINFGNFKLVTISGKKFSDLNGNHVKNEGEPGLSGWVISLDKENNINPPVCTGGTIVGELCVKTTNSSGNYSFTNLQPGTYRISETLQTNWTQTRPGFFNSALYGGQGAQVDGTYLLTVASGTNITSRDFGNMGNLSITACKFEDSNGTAEGGDFTPVNGWDFILNNQNTQNTREGNCTTFMNLTPGEYSVSESLDGWFSADGSGGVQSITLPTEITTLNFYNYRKGEINGLKWNDEDGDGEQGEESGLGGWVIFLDKNNDGILDEGEDSKETDEGGFYSFTDLEPGTYRVCEDDELQSGWNQTYPQDSELNNCHEITLNSGDISENNDFGNQGEGTITVFKNIDTDGDGQIDEENVTDWTWDINGEGNYPTGNQARIVVAGDYTVSEDQKDGYHVTSPECNNEEVYDPTESIRVTIEPGRNLVCTFTNTRDMGDLRVNKVADTDGDGQYDATNPENFLWGVSSDETNFSMGSTETFITGDYEVLENSVAGFSFTGWFPGGPVENRYSCTNLPEGDIYTQLPVAVTVERNEPMEITLCNQVRNPILTISKSNDKTGVDLQAGSSVMYTLVIEATQSAALDVVVKDLLPDGFTYRSGSWTVNSSTRGNITSLITEPVYASPGTWNLGNMAVGEKITLTYIADIAGDKQPGLYKDLAWAFGCSGEENCSVDDENAVFASAQDPGFVDTNFVGTQVNIVKNPDGTGANIEREETKSEVLGISTSMPATGANSFWLILAGILLSVGTVSTIAGIKSRRKNV